MKIKIKGQVYNLLLWKHLIPVGLIPFVDKLPPPVNKCKIRVSEDDRQLNGKRVLITGGYRGIGYAIAETFVREGAKVLITGRNEQKLLEACRSLGNDNACYLVWDISDTSVCVANFKKAIDLLETIDLLVNNAGVTTDGKTRPSFEIMTDKHFQYVNDINVVGTVCMCKTYSDMFEEASIINIISNTATYSAKDAYFMSKWALLSFTKTYGEKASANGKCVRLNGICPGPIKTIMTYKAGGNLLRTDIPDRRIGLPEEIAAMALNLAIGTFAGMNGKVYSCDGGETLK